MDSLNGARDALDNGARVLAGEQPDQAMNMGGELPGQLPPVGDVDSDLDAEDDGFAATDAAAGGQEELGRERR
jgi:hypothetical protein